MDRVLSFADGGARGVLSLQVAQTVEQKTLGPFPPRATLLCRTSTGAIIAAGLAAGM